MRLWVCSALVTMGVGAGLGPGCGGVDDLTIDYGPPDTTFQGGPTCAGGQFFDGGSPYGMAPGEACNACHADGGGGGPIFHFAGTLFAEGHAEDGCLPSAAEQADLSQAEVAIIGADGTTITPPLSTQIGFSNGNFSTFESVPLPYTARVVYMGKERAMLTPQTTGDCNTCHAVTGTNGAPGRIALPR